MTRWSNVTDMGIIGRATTWPSRTVAPTTRLPVSVSVDADRDVALTRAREQTFVATRRYVRRQRSWFRRDHRVCWLNGADAGTVDDAVRAWQHVS